MLGHNYGYVDKIAKLIPFEIGMTLEKALAQEEELRRLYEGDEAVFRPVAQNFPDVGSKKALADIGGLIADVIENRQITFRSAIGEGHVLKRRPAKFNPVMNRQAPAILPHRHAVIVEDAYDANGPRAIVEGVGKLCGAAKPDIAKGIDHVAAEIPVERFHQRMMKEYEAGVPVRDPARREPWLSRNDDAVFVGIRQHAGAIIDRNRISADPIAADRYLAGFLIIITDAANDHFRGIDHGRQCFQRARRHIIVIRHQAKIIELLFAQTCAENLQRMVAADHRSGLPDQTQPGVLQTVADNRFHRNCRTIVRNQQPPILIILLHDAIDSFKNQGGSVEGRNGDQKPHDDPRKGRTRNSAAIAASRFFSLAFGVGKINVDAGRRCCSYG